MKEREATPPHVEGQPRRNRSRRLVSVSRRLTELRGGQAAVFGIGKRKLAARTILLLTAHRLLLALVLLSAFCLLPTAFSQDQPQTQPQTSPTPSPTPSPSPSPTPPPNLHQWGAVTSF